MGSWFSKPRVIRHPQMRVQPVTQPPSAWWFCPTAGSDDLIDVVLGSDLRARVSVVQCYPSTFQDPTISEVALRHIGPNRFETFRQRDVMRQLKARGFKLSLEVGAVKERGRDLAREAQQAIDGVTALGGTVDYLAMDEPFTFGREVLHQPVTETVTETVAFMRRFPAGMCGLVEAYPIISADDIVSAVDAITAQPGGALAFLHLDVDLNDIRTGEPGYARAAVDLARMRDACVARQLPFGVVVWGCDDFSDEAFVREARNLVGVFQDAFGQQWPDRVIVQSWGRRDGVLNVPRTAVLRDLLAEVRAALGVTNP